VIERLLAVALSRPISPIAGSTKWIHPISQSTIAKQSVDQSFNQSTIVMDARP
jgi:hypothetical protein